jgi:hypothetical protein
MPIAAAVMILDVLEDWETQPIPTRFVSKPNPFNLYHYHPSKQFHSTTQPENSIITRPISRPKIIERRFTTVSREIKRVSMLPSCFNQTYFNFYST